jgi:hypothetical protein
MHDLGYSVSAANAEPPSKQPPHIHELFPDPNATNATIDIIFDRPALREYLSLEKFHVTTPAESSGGGGGSSSSSSIDSAYSSAADIIRRTNAGLPLEPEAPLRKCESEWDGACDRSAFTGKAGAERQRRLGPLNDRKDPKGEEKEEEEEEEDNYDDDDEEDEPVTFDAMKQVHEAMEKMAGMPG